MIKFRMDINKLKQKFPILVNQDISYLDNAATTQKPDNVIDSISEFYSNFNSNVHRGLYPLATKASEVYEEARKAVADFINADPDEIIFISGATEALNGLSRSLLNSGILNKDSTITLTQLEHHSNLLPWQKLTNKNIEYLNVKDDFTFEEDAVRKINTDLFSFPLVSNVTGTIFPINYLSDFNGITVADATQAVGHIKVDVKELDVDFLVFSGHKMYGPMGIGVLYGKKNLLEKLQPFNVGGGMIRQVDEQDFIHSGGVEKFEAGTPNIVGGIALGAALDYLTSFDSSEISNHEDSLLKYGTEKLLQIDGLKIIGTSDRKASVISFVIDGIHPYDIGTIIDTDGIAIRTGHHCTMPLIKRFNLPATARASFSMYNKIEEIDHLYNALLKVKRMFI